MLIRAFQQRVPKGNDVRKARKLKNITEVRLLKVREAQELSPLDFFSDLGCAGLRLETVALPVLPPVDESDHEEYAGRSSIHDGNHQLPVVVLRGLVGSERLWANPVASSVPIEEISR